MTTPSDRDLINAAPTKEFFISMLVKDIELSRAIIDLIDNSVDGARRLRPKGNYNGLWVHLDVSSKRFAIRDNCGGISVELARDYAFRFGRPQAAKPTPHSIGQFGVGMKRALFKLGPKFSVESTTSSSHFEIRVDVAEWQKDPDPLWHFVFHRLDESIPTVPRDRRGTIIEVPDLHPSVAADFDLESFRNRLAREIGDAHVHSIERGLEVRLNGRALTPTPPSLYTSRQIQTGYREFSVPRYKPPVRVQVYSGIGESSPTRAGWYVFCNGRLVLPADQTGLSGWGERSGAGERVPRYHNQFAMFRGFVFYESESAALLPWNTTKTGVDADSGTFRATRQTMLTLMRPVIDFLNKYDAENDIEEPNPQPLHEAVASAKLAPLAKIATADTFKYPKPRTVEQQPPNTGRIVYHRPIEEIRKAQRALGVRTYHEVGEQTFDYFIRMECDD